MVNKFLHKEIAQQAGFSLATVDRALHGRANVSTRTIQRVKLALEELVEQEGQLAVRGQRMFVDIVVEAPKRFSDEVRSAVQYILPRFSSAIIRPRYHFFEEATAEKIVKTLKNISARGSQGIILKVQNIPEVRNEITRLTKLNLPVVTVFTDCPGTERLAYAGLNNENAGRTAAYLFAQRFQGQTGTVLTTTSHLHFQGEDARAKGFAHEMNRLCPNLDLIDASGGAGLALSTASKITDALQGINNFLGVYSMGGGNAAILMALKAKSLVPELFVAHDLDRENRQLLRQGHVHYILHHDLQSNLDCAFQHIASFYKSKVPTKFESIVDVQIITIHNCPRA